MHEDARNMNDNDGIKIKRLRNVVALNRNVLKVC